MKNIVKIILVGVLMVSGFSCTDESLDPLQFTKVKKGTLLALRGAQLDAIYFDGAAYGAAFFADAVQGDETFEFDAEFLSEDPNSLESVDLFVIKRSGTTKTRVSLANIPSSAFQTTDDYRGPWTSVSIDLADVLDAIAVDASTVAGQDELFDTYAEGVVIEADLNLTDGSKVLAADLVAAGLFESDQFYPAQILTYGVESIEDAKPVPTTSLRGQYAVVSGKVVRTIIPLKNLAKDTLNITFDQSIDTPPSVSISPVSAGTVGTVTPVAGKDNQFYVPFVAGGTYTGDVTFTITGATSAESGALNGLVQADKTATLAVDNQAPANTTFTTGTRLGKGQSAVVTLRFNEALGTAPKITIDPGATGIDGVTNVSTTLSTDGLTATYTYEYKDLNGDATHGDATVSVVSTGTDRAGNAVPAIASKTLTVDLGAAPAPSIVLDGAQYDWGTQIKWTFNYALGGSNPGGSTSGTVYFVAVNAGAAAPTGFVGGDVPAFTMASGSANAAKQTGTATITTGTSGSVYSAFAPNGNLEVYAVFLSSTGVISAISSPLAVTMN
jgi:hypothetical protein